MKKKRYSILAIILLVIGLIAVAAGGILEADSPTNSIYIELEIVEGDQILIYESGGKTPLESWNWANMKPGYTQEKTFKVYNTTANETIRRSNIRGDVSNWAEVSFRPEIFTLEPGGYEYVTIIVFIKPDAQPVVTGFTLAFDEYIP